MQTVLGIPVDILMNLATILFLTSSAPQMLKSYKRRKKGLIDFSWYSWVICLSGIIIMIMVGFGVGAWATVIIEVLQAIYHIITLYWIFKYRKS